MVLAKEESTEDKTVFRVVQKKVILAVDDIRLHLMRINEVLSPDYDVRIAKSAMAALKIMTSEKIDLVLLDIEMPGVSGLDLLEAINRGEDTKKIPVIFVTSHATGDFVLRAKEAGAKGYLIKPYDREKLTRMVQDALQEA
ncbi:MAG: response regulator [Synergistaceae bacterium]|jgi:CheY-like chemotaxis protein|nr:response regulator [Synergistaceae bacterium]